MSAYYNEHDPKKAAWLRDLIKRNLIAPGDVDERSIEDVLPNELAGYAQCHFFAGVGVWSYALRNAGWPDSCPVWTGSCPCQPFSTAGKGDGFADERHLWPAWFHLIQQRKPDVVFGEQVESKDGRAWLDVVQADLEANSYAVGPVGLCAAGFGAPHIRQRLFFVADATSQRYDGRRASKASRWAGEPERSRNACSLANTNGSERRSPAERRCNDSDGSNAGRQETASGFEFCGEAGCLGDTGSERFQERIGNGRIQSRTMEPSERQAAISRSATNGFWADAEWLYCRDGKYRAVEPGTFPLANGAAARVGRLSGYGDAIVAPVAEAFIRAYIQTQEEGER